jgi:hypothetical protein
LLAAGWEPYGVVADVYDFKKNAVKLSARISAAPAQGGKTMLDYSTLLLSADIPLPPGAVSVQYSDTPTQVGFDLDGKYDVVEKFYREKLAKQGWEPTTDKTVKIDWKDFLIFRNPEKDLLEMQLTTVDDKTRAMVRFQTAAEVAEMDKAVKAEAERIKAERAKAEGPKPKLALKLPAGAANVEADAAKIEFTLPIGKARAAVEALVKRLAKAGWKEEDGLYEPMVGNVTLNKGEQSLTITYVESGVLKPEVTISARGVELVAE